MNLDYDAQREFCIRLGLIAADSPRMAWWDDETCRQVAGLIDAMRKQADTMASAKSWVLSGLGDDDRRFEGEEVHSVTSIGGIARQALDYDMAASAYTALQDQLQNLVIRVRVAQGYEPRALSRLEDHPVLTPGEDQARRDLATLEAHLADFAGMTPTAARRHLAEGHMRKATRVPGLNPADAMAQLTAIHDGQHELELEARREVMSSIDPARLAAAGAR